MSKLAQATHALGFSAILVAPALLAASAITGEPFLTVGVVFILFPLARAAFGSVRASSAQDHSAFAFWVASVLPRVYVPALVAGLGAVMWKLATHAHALVDTAGWVISLWVTLTFATCVAHELLHRETALDRRVGHLLAGIAGYPVLSHEHLRHHHRPGDSRSAEWPRVSESVWSFSWRRATSIASETMGPNGVALKGAIHAPGATGLRLALVGTIGTMSTFALVAGWEGAAVYGTTCALVWFAVQLVTYLQHWGLGDDSISDARGRDAAWEDDCRFQAWVTMGLSLHMSHHHEPRRPYHELSVLQGSPQPPVGYVLLMLAALVPPIWRRVMRPALDHWKASPTNRPSAGRRIICVVAYR